MTANKIISPDFDTTSTNAVVVELASTAQVSIDASSGLTDAFGRFRVSDPFTIFAHKQICDLSEYAQNVENFPSVYDNQEVSGGSTATLFLPNEAATRLSVGATTAGKRVRQSRRRMNYQPGKSQRVQLTGVLGAGAVGITQQYGLFDDKNGLFFQVEDGGLAVVRRSYITGAAVDEVVDQGDWNRDRMDGTGPSGITLDLDATQIFYIDFEWLGVGGVRFGVVVDNIIYYVHQMNHANNLPTVYMSTPNLPVRMSVENDGTGPAYTVDMICSNVDSEGGVEPQGRSRTYNIGVTPLALASAANKYAVIGLKMRASHIGQQVDLTDVNIVITSVNDSCLWELHVNPTLSAPLVYANLPDSAMQVATGTGQTLTANGYKIASDYGRTEVKGVLPDNMIEKPGAAIDGTPDEYVLVCQPVTAPVSVLAALNWRELV